MGHRCAEKSFYSLTINTVPLHYRSVFFILFFWMEKRVVTFYSLHRIGRDQYEWTGNVKKTKLLKLLAN